MKHDEFYRQSYDNLKLYWQCWSPNREAAGVVCLIHGLGEHSGRYAYLASALSAANFATITFDLRGHGKSEGKRGDTPSYEAYLKDMDLLIREAGERFPGIPCFLLGHSLGSTMVLYYTLKRQPTLTGVIGTGPGFKTDLTSQTGKVIIARILGVVLGSASLHTGLVPTTLSRDPRVVQSYVADPLIHDRATLRFGKASLEAITWTYKHAAEFPLPMLLMHGTLDRLCYPKGTQEFAERVPGFCTLKLWDGLFHEIFNEPEKDQVIAYLIEWMERQIKMSLRQSTRDMGKSEPVSDPV
jgi:alpha-beta hydrolase superfamily lysophospholipase